VLAGIIFLVFLLGVANKALSKWPGLEKMVRPAFNGEFWWKCCIVHASYWSSW
jgi:hypothetical protein